MAKDTPWISWQILQGLDNQSHRLRPWSLTNVMTRMYGFTLEKSKNEEEHFPRSEEALLLACRIHNDSTSKNLCNEANAETKAKLEFLFTTINAITSSRENDIELIEARQVMIQWLYHIELEIYFVVVDLILFASTFNQSAAIKIQESLRLRLGALKRRSGGRVLVVVYRMLALFESDASNDSLIMEENDRVVCCRDVNEREVLSNVYGLLANQVFNMILRLMNVLYAISGLSCLRLSKKEVLLGSEEIVERCDEELRAIRARIDEATVKILK